MTINCIIMGMPGSGKGTQCSKLLDVYGDRLHFISTGNMLRQEIARDTKLGRLVADVINKGSLVDDSIVIQMVDAELKECVGYKNIFFDGFPRTIAQARALDGVMQSHDTKISRVLYIETNIESLLQRMLTRLVCKGCGAVYNTIVKMPSSDGICDVCGEVLHGREDDVESVILSRLQSAQSGIDSLLSYYNSQKVNVDIISGGMSIEDVHKAIVDILLADKRFDI